MTGWPRVSDLGVAGLCVSEAWRSHGLTYAEASFRRGCSVQDVWKCVLSEWFCCGTGVDCCLGFLSGGWLLCMAGLFWKCMCCKARVRDEHEKGIGWMPWRQEAMKDVARCENLGGAASGR